MNDRAALECFLQDQGLSYRSAAGGREFVIDCPFCGDTKGHLYINADTTTYDCKKCHAAGNLTVLRRHFGDPDQNGDRPAPRTSIRPAPSAKAEDLTARALRNHAALPPEARAYLEGRGLGLAIDRFKLGYRRDANGDSWVTIPYFSGDKVTQIRRRAMPGTPADISGRKYQGDADVPVEVYNIDALDGRHALLVEGEFKAALLSLALPDLAVVGLPGTTFKKPWAAMFADVERIYVAFDPGEQHSQALANLVDALGPARLRIVDAPDKPDDFVRARGADAFRDLLVTAHSAEMPVPEREADLLRFRFPQEGVTIEVSQCEENGPRIEGWLEVRSTTHGRLHAAPTSLTALQTRTALATRFRKRLPEVNWDNVLDHVAYTTIETVRRVGENELVYPQARVAEFLVERFLERGELTMLYGPPESAKGNFLLFLLQALEFGVALPHGLRPGRRVRTLYGDYESHRGAFADRVSKVRRGLGIAPDRPSLYRKMHRPLREEWTALARDLDRDKIDVLVVDSYLFAAGDESYGNDASAQLFRPLAAAVPAVTSIVLNHESRKTMASTGRRSPFGAVAGEAIVRSAWEARRSEDSEGTGVVFALYHRKANERAHEKPLAFRLVFERDAVRLLEAEIDAQADLARPLTVADRILAFLAEHKEKAATSTIAEALETPERLVRNKLALLFRQGKVARFGDHAAPGRPQLWALPSSRQEELSP